MSKSLTIALTLAFLAMTAVLTPLPLSFATLEPADAIQILTALFMIALVLERALEVFVATWRAPDMQILTLSIRRARRRLQQAKASGVGVDAANTAVRALEEDEQKYRTGTQIFALRLAFLFGIVVSTVGVRSFEGLLAPGALLSASPFQSVAFRVVDVFMTGGVIAGGSDAIHKMIQLVTTFIDATTKRVKAGPGGNLEDEVTADTDPSTGSAVAVAIASTETNPDERST